MTNPDKQVTDDKNSGKPREGEVETDASGGGKAPAEHDESAYPNDDYWENGKGKKSRVPPDESPEPENGYRWDS